jgi:hypothetical protein
MKYTLVISGKHFSKLQSHLYPGDGNEAVAVALCGRQVTKDQTKLLVHEIILIPYDQCEIRTPYLIKWSTKIIIPLLEKAMKKDMAILKIHSHPNGFKDFSNTDDVSDNEFFSSVYGWMENDKPHASAIMLPTGEIFSRIFFSNLETQKLDKVIIAGDDILVWNTKQQKGIEEFALRTAQAFGEGTTNKLKTLKIGVVGCSGTGSPLIEQLVRLGIGEIVLIDPDKIEKKNLNRIYNSTMKNVRDEEFKVDVIARAIKKMGIGTKVNPINKNLYDSREVTNEIASCDVLFGCMDSIDGRHLLNLIATFYLIPYFDVGVKLVSDKKGGIDQIMATVHYLQPGGSSLRTRGVYGEEELRAASLLRTNKNHYEEQKKMGYIVDIEVESPAVISINTQISSMAVNEFLARIHSFRYDANKDFSVTRISFTDSYIQHEPDGEPDMYLEKFVGRGDAAPYLNMQDFK